MAFGGAAFAREQVDARLAEDAPHALTLDVAAEERVQGYGAAEAREAERLARRGAADRLPVAEGELHVRHGLRQAVELDDAVPRRGPGDEDVIGHPFILAGRGRQPPAIMPPTAGGFTSGVRSFPQRAH